MGFIKGLVFIVRWEVRQSDWIRLLRRVGNSNLLRNEGFNLIAVIVV